MEARWLRESPLASVLLAACVTSMLWISFASFRDQFVVYSWDDWRILRDFYEKDLVDWIFTAQNGHRVPVTLALFAADYTFFSGLGHSMVAATLLSAWICAGLLLLTPRLDPVVSPLARGVATAACFLLFWSGSIYFFPWGMCHGNLWATQWLLVSLLCAAGYQRARRAGTTPHSALLPGAGVAALLASFAVGNGMAAWAGLLGVALLARFPVRATMALAAGFVACAFLYAHGLEGRAVAPGVGLRILLEDPIGVARFVLAYLGSAFGWAVSGLGWVRSDAIESLSQGFGAVGVLALTRVAGVALRSGARCLPLRLFALGLMGFGVATAGVVALARLPFAGASGPLGEATAIRHVYWSALFWSGAVLAIPGTGRSRAVERGALLLLVVVCAGLWGAQDALRRPSLLRQGRAEVAWAGIVLGLREDSVLRGATGPFSRQIERARDTLERLEAEGRNGFARPVVSLIGEVLDDRFAIAPMDRCRGGLRRPVRIGRTGRSLAGHAWDTRRDAPPELVVLTSDDGRIHGFGVFAPFREIALQSGTALAERWRGYARAAGPLTAWAVLTDGSACRLASGRPHQVPKRTEP